MQTTTEDDGLDGEREKFLDLEKTNQEQKRSKVNDFSEFYSPYFDWP